MLSQVLFLVFLTTSLQLAHSFKSGCKFAVDVDSVYLPLLWNDKGIIYPTYSSDDDKWYIEALPGTSFKAGCSTADNFIRYTKQTEIDVECVMGSVIRTPSGLENFDQLLCLNELTETVTRNGTCYNGFTNIEIAFMTAEKPYSIITVCHNEDLDETLLAKNYIYGARLNESESITRPSFKEAGFYPTISADTCYTQKGQNQTVAELLGSDDLAVEYIQTSKNLYMARGHLAPNGDPIYGYEKKATFYFVNASPQWQTINGGNWVALENAARAYAKAKAATLTVYTGSYGVTKLNDINGNAVELWLGRNSKGELVKKLPVNHLTWKVIHDEVRRTAVAVIQINNPYWTIDPADILCNNICSQLSWVTWRVEDIRLGYTYCCDVASFSRAISYAPMLGNLPLLDY